MAGDSAQKRQAERIHRPAASLQIWSTNHRDKRHAHNEPSRLSSLMTTLTARLDASYGREIGDLPLITALMISN